MLTSLKQESFLLLALLAALVAYPLEHALLNSGQGVALISGLLLIGFIVAASMRVAHHAELLAEKVGDPYGTMILTLAAVLVEVVILAIMMSNEASPTLVRDTIYSAVMLDINGILGLAALMGGIKHGEQAYNDDSARSYSVMILTAMGVSMVVPEFIPEAKWKLYSAFTIGAMVLLYTLFLRMQVGALAEVMSKTLDLGLEGTGAPPVITAILVAAISAAPEILTALRAALANRMQSVVNIALGASLSTVILTVPVMEAMALYTGQPFQMAMTPVQTVMIFITLIVSAINLNDGETNAIEGMTHFVLFATFIMLSLLGL
ncbi:calcium:proton antiporter [Pseudomonas chlororaphis]|uniref:Calcium:proton antiporter n=1 Tax=Pseudomonas chlororaphis subsp. aurantiaca TaxID=86192 RepID=A0AAJ1E424_9PSED|nr:calcium:proton antiporter [Pseudomonas chlororaphis]MBU4635213.1 calcium:proton antiporter [Pseudomonas chlororaphis subsp. aurantiaca]